MEIFSNWIFWVVLASIVFVLALIGYLTESMKKDKKDDKKKEEPDVVPEVTAPVTPETNEVNIPAQNDDWTTMPKVDSSLEEVKVDSISEVADSTNSADGVFTSPVSDTEVSTLEPVTSEVQGLNVETPAMSLNNESVSSDNVAMETPLEVSSEETTQTPIVDTSAQETPIETLNTDDTQAEKNSDIWNRWAKHRIYKITWRKTNRNNWLR